MKTTATAVNKVVSILNNEANDFDTPAFKYAKPGAINDSEYVVVNSLPINAELMQVCTVNVNYHVNDLAEGIPDIDRLETGSNAAIELLHGCDEFGDDVNIHIELDESIAQQIIRDEALHEHYSNMRFKVRIANKN